MNFSGTYTALITPFTADGKEVDYNAFEALIEDQITAGVDGVVIAGTTGESPTLTWEENDELIKKAVEIVKKRIIVIAGTGSNCTREAVEHSRLAQDHGADALLVVAPYYNKPSQNGIYDYFAQVCSAVQIPVVVYNIQGRCGVNIETKTLKRLADEYKNIQAVKEASGSFSQAQEVRKVLGDDFPILSGEESLTFSLLENGCGNGVISVLSNALPKEVKQLVDAGLQKDFEQGSKQQQYLLEKIEACFLETNPVPIKTLLSAQGKCQKVFRSPLVKMESQNEQKLLEIFHEFL